mmetsp:Transcript_19510/g.26792  ORF Transcript_19510/g.26792 Transcript_19510/m.26792 type:complete len:295 (-) Transcript_19510:1089-1973(-)
MKTIYALVFLMCIFGKVCRATIAFAVQGKAEDVTEWINMVSIMKTKDFSSLFVLSYDLPVDKSLCDNNIRIICLFQPKSTWRKGRNMLTRSIAKYEEQFNHHFKYWIFGDDDVIKIKSCGKFFSSSPQQQIESPSIAMTAFCFDSIVQQLSNANVQYAVVGYTSSHKDSLIEDTLGFLHGDCSDAALTAIHHLAVPILLPYVELLDNITWWAALWNHLIIGCFPGYSVYDPVFQYGNGSHALYPRNVTNAQQLKSKAFRQVYGSLDLIPYPISEENIKIMTPKQGNCANISYSQ